MNISNMRFLTFLKKDSDFWFLLSFVSIILLTKGLAQGTYSNFFEFFTFFKLVVICINSASYYYYKNNNFVEILIFLNLILYICLL